MSPLLSAVLRFLLPFRDRECWVYRRLLITVYFIVSIRQNGRNIILILFCFIENEECLDLDNGTLTIKQQLRREQHKDGQFYFSKPKNNKTRTLTLAPSVVKLFRLQKLEQNGKRLKAGKSWTEKDLVFSNEVGGFLSHRVIYRCFKELVKEIGTPSTRFHDLRHTYAVMAIQSGDDIKTVQENLGHATAAFTLDVYGHVTAQMKQASADRMEKKIQAVSGL